MGPRCLGKIFFTKFSVGVVTRTTLIKQNRNIKREIGVDPDTFAGPILVIKFLTMTDLCEDLKLIFTRHVYTSQ